MSAVRKLIGLTAVIGLLAVISLSAQAANEGMAILESRCSSCHNLTGPAPATLKELWARKGPDLFYAGNKYKRSWLESWLQKPRRIRPAGVFYVNHIKPGKDRDVIDESTLEPHVALSAEEAHEVAEALMALKANSHLITKGEYKPGNISLTMGEMRFDKFRGCMACHEIEPGYGGLSGPEVYTVARRLQEDYMMSFMRNPQAWDPKSFMPNQHLREGDLEKFVHYFRALSKEDFE